MPSKPTPFGPSYLVCPHNWVHPAAYDVLTDTWRPVDPDTHAWVVHCPCPKCVAYREVRETTPSPEKDTPTGFDRAPDRYTARGRETIDRQRDAAHLLASLHYDGVATPEQENALADLLFIYHCRMCEMKYLDREGLKDESETERLKAHFYSEMASHVASPNAVPDPRSNRPDFKPYERPK